MNRNKHKIFVKQESIVPEKIKINNGIFKSYTIYLESSEEFTFLEFPEIDHKMTPESSPFTNLVKLRKSLSRAKSIRLLFLVDKYSILGNVSKHHFSGPVKDFRNNGISTQQSGEFSNRSNQN